MFVEDLGLLDGFSMPSFWYLFSLILLAMSSGEVYSSTLLEASLLGCFWFPPKLLPIGSLLSYSYYL